MPVFPQPRRADDAPHTPVAVNRLAGLTIAAAVVVLGYTLGTWDSPDAIKYGSFFLLAVLSAGMHLKLPGANGTLPLTWLFVLLSILELTPQETMLLTGGASLAQYFWLPREDRRARQVLFDIGASVVASAVAVRLFHSEWLLRYGFDQAARLAIAAFGMFLAGSI